MSFSEIEINDININPFNDMKNKWMLITAEKDGVVNTMTASWGMIGTVWADYSALILVRESRFTKEFIDNSDMFSLSFFEGYKKELTVLGTKSGRDGNKISEVGFNVGYFDGVPYFEEATKVLICKKNFMIDTDDSNILDKSILSKCYANGDFHTFYIGKIIKAMVRN